MSNKILMWSIVAALAGFLFGFDTAVISGAEQSIQRVFETSDVMHGIAMSSALWGTVIGAMFGSYPNDKWGRKITLITIGFLYLLSAILSAMAWDVASFTIARFIGGLGVGISTIAAPGYIAEIAPDKYRGRLVVLYQLSLVLGIFAAFLSNFVIGGTGVDDWRWMLGIEAIPALVFFIFTFKLVESPRWLYHFKQDHEAARRVLARMTDDVDSEFTKVEAERAPTKKSNIGFKLLFSRSIRTPIVLALLLGLFNQLSGINAIIYYAPRILEMTGSNESAALLATVGIGIVNIIFTLLGLYLIDRLGRRTLMLVGSLGYICSLSVIGWNFITDAHENTAIWIFAFIASHAIGQGAVIWVYIAEIFSTTYRSFGQSIGSSAHWVAAAILTFVMPPLLSQFPASSIFFTFALFMCLQLVFVLKLMVETKSKSMEEIQLSLART